MVQLLTGLGDVLEQIAVGIGPEQNGADGAHFLVGGSPPEAVDRGDLFLRGVGINLGNLVVSVGVDDADEAVAVTSRHQGILIPELGAHEFGFVRDGRLQDQLRLQWHFLYDPTVTSFGTLSLLFPGLSSFSIHLYIYNIIMNVNICLITPS